MTTTAVDDQFATDPNAQKEDMDKQEWQPIETAPRDGRNIIGFTPYGVEVVRWCSWDGGKFSPGNGWIGIEQDSTCLPPNFRRPKPQHQPTHWMPIPAPPNTAPRA